MNLYLVFDDDKNPVEIYKFPHAAIAAAQSICGTIEIWKLNEQDEKEIS